MDWSAELFRASSLLRTHFSAHPLFVWGLFAVGLLVLRRFDFAALHVSGPFRHVVMIAYVTLVGAYVLHPGYSDHIEPSVAAISWLAVRGQDVYPSPEGAIQYALPYGPFLFLANGVVLWLLQPSVFASKVLGGLAALASLIVLRAALRRLDAGNAFVTSVTLAYLCFGTMSLWTRAEPMLLLLTSLSLLALARGSQPALIAVGACAGAAVGVKLTALLCFAPVFWIVWRTKGITVTLLVAGVAAAIAMAPFALGNVSLDSYVGTITSTATHGVRWRSIGTQFEWGALALTPSLVTVRSWSCSRALTSDRCVLALALSLMVFVAAKEGAGPYHFIPFIPVVAYLQAMRNGDTQSRGSKIGLAALTAAMVTLATVQQLHTVLSLATSESGRMTAEITRTRQELGVMPMAYSANYRPAMLRALTVFAGAPYIWDAPALMDRSMARHPFPTAALDFIKSCEIPAWIMPADGAPFALPNAYEGPSPVFPAEFQRAFTERYRRVVSGRYYDVWRCNGADR